MEGDSSVIMPNDGETQNCDSLSDPFMTVRGLAFLQTQISIDQRSDDNTKSDHEENYECEPTLATGESLIILEEEDLDTEHSKLLFGPEKIHALISKGETNGCKNGDSILPSRLNCGFRCHTSNIEHLYCMWHGAKYCCRVNGSNSNSKRTIEEDVFDNCLNYLECSDVMVDDVNGIWLSVLLGNDPVFLLESDQVDETSVSQDCLNERYPLLSGVTPVNEVSNNNVATDGLTSPCVSHSEPPALDVKGDFPGDSLTALQPEMVITVGHQQDHTSSLKRKDRCSLPLATAAIQNDQAGIEEESVENSPGGDIKACVKQSNSNPYMELYLANVLDNSVKGLTTMTDESTANSFICACSEDTEYEGGKQILEVDLMDERYPEIPAEHLQEQEVNHFSMESIPDTVANGNNSTGNLEEKQDQENQPDGRGEYSHLLMELMNRAHHCTIDHAQEHTELIQFLKENIRSSESSGESNEESNKTEIYTDTQGLKETKQCLSQTDNVVDHRDDISENCNSVIDELPIHFENSERNEILANGPRVVDRGSEIVNTDLQIVDNGLEIVTNELQTVDIDSQFHGIACDKPISDIKCQESKIRPDCADNKTCNKSTQGCEFTNSISNAHIDIPTTKFDDVCDQVTVENTLMDVALKPSVLNGTNICVKTSKKSNGFMLDNRTSEGNILRTNSSNHLNGEQTKPKHQDKVKMNIKKNAAHHSSLNSICSPFNKGNQKINGSIAVENYQGGGTKKPLICLGGSRETVSLVKTIASLHNNTTEIEKAPSHRVKDCIPNSNQLSQVCRDPDTIRGTVSARALTSNQDQAKGSSCSTLFMRSTSFCEKNTENRMVKKKFKSGGNEAKGMKNELQALDVNEVFPPEEGKRVRRENSTETASTKDNKKAPQLLHSIQAEMFPDCAENLKLYCHFGEIHADSTITWTKDSKLLARIHRSSKDDSPVSLAIVQTSKRDQGLYHCTLKNVHGKVTTEFQLTAEVLDQLTCNQDFEGGEAIEFNQLFFREDFITDMYFGGNLHGRIATEDLHFGEGVHRKAFRSKVMCGLLPVFNSGHLCVLKVHNAIAYGTKTNDELVQKNYKLAVQECYVQNAAREYAKIYASETEQLEEFGKVPEIIPIFLIHRPANNIPYATVEEELIGDFVKYSIKDGKEINVMRKDSEAGQKCCTFQHWVFEKTSGNLLVTDMQGVGMKLTDVGIATIAKG
ncbi:alpha-protein kinase 2 isoform X2 [Mixophyes fleayi]